METAFNDFGKILSTPRKPIQPNKKKTVACFITGIDRINKPLEAKGRRPRSYKKILKNLVEILQGSMPPEQMHNIFF